jgi:hypothetical protein
LAVIIGGFGAMHKKANDVFSGEQNRFAFVTGGFGSDAEESE